LPRSAPTRISNSFDQAGREAAALEHLDEVVGGLADALTRGLAHGDADVAAGDPVVEDRVRHHLVVEHDGHLAADVLARHRLEAVGAVAVELEVDLGGAGLLVEADVGGDDAVARDLGARLDHVGAPDGLGPAPRRVTTGWMP
jgi:hypothetical protein